MATLAQIEAARRNGARSRGPITPEGKQTSSQNAVTHGLTAKKVFVLSSESDETFYQLLSEFIREHQPQTTLEQEMVVELTHAWWRIRRLHAIETGLFDKMLADQEETAARKHGRSEGFPLAEAFQELTHGNNALRTLSQYETRLFRIFNTLSSKLTRIRAERVNEPEPQGSRETRASVPADSESACANQPSTQPPVSPEEPATDSDPCLPESGFPSSAPGPCLAAPDFPPSASRSCLLDPDFATDFPPTPQ